MDGSNETMIFTHIFIAWTLFGVLLIWIFLFALLALRPEAKKKVEETSYSSPVVMTTTPEIVRASTAQVQMTALASVKTLRYEESSSVEVAPLA